MRGSVKQQPADVTRKTCPLRDEWLSWSQSKREDRIFMICPVCKTYGCHIGEKVEVKDGPKH